jgi:hypothetical protein
VGVWGSGLRKVVDASSHAGGRREREMERERGREREREGDRGG